jgi:3-oxoacyl-[acyl-carrier-protein] synthase-1
MLNAESYIEITPASVVRNGQPIAVSETGDRMLVELYRRYAGDYPKFFKMDTLCRLGFIAAEILLKEPTANSQQPTAIIMANRSASIKNDTDYLATISDGNYYPSPSLFVYTLPNIVTGEIAIRHHIQGETAFYILDTPEQLETIVKSQKSKTQSPEPILCGWVECSAANEFYAKLQIIWNN